MTWSATHRRGEVLRTVVDVANSRRDGILPIDVPGLAETFPDDLALVSALQLRWHTRLSGRIERALMEQPMDLEAAVLTAWRSTAAELPGVRAIIDAHTAHPTSEAMATALASPDARTGCCSLRWPARPARPTARPAGSAAARGPPARRTTPRPPRLAWTTGVSTRSGTSVPAAPAARPAGVRPRPPLSAPAATPSSRTPSASALPGGVAAGAPRCPADWPGHDR